MQSKKRSTYQENALMMFNRFLQLAEQKEHKTLIMDMKHAFLELPTVDAVEVAHGQWKRTSKYDAEAPVQCSECLMVFDYIDGICYLVADTKLPHYCPNCGAKMDGGDQTLD